MSRQDGFCGIGPPVVLVRLLAVLVAAAVLAGCLDAAPRAETLAIPRATEPEGTAAVAMVTLGVVQADEAEYGIATPMTVTVTAPGAGIVDVDSPYELGEDTRQSVVDAALAAAFVAGVDAASYDYTVTFDVRAAPMDGPSAGSQFALGFYVALANLLDPSHGLRLDPTFAGTGTIASDGTVGPVGGVPLKAEAAAEHGHLFAYPAGAVREPGKWMPRSVDMDEVCGDAGLECVQVATLADLVEAATLRI